MNISVILIEQNHYNLFIHQAFSCEKIILEQFGQPVDLISTHWNPSFCMHYHPDLMLLFVVHAIHKERGGEKENVPFCIVQSANKIFLGLCFIVA